MAEKYTVVEDFELEEFAEGRWRIKSYLGYDLPPFIIIPSTINGKRILEIGESLFEFQIQLQGVKIEDGIAKICDDAFKQCTNLYYVDFGKTLKVIGDYAFGGCPLYKIVFPKTLVKIGESAFQDWDENCDLIDIIKIPKSVKEIKKYSF